MTHTPEITVSVKELLEFTFFPRDLNSYVASAGRAAEGIAGHRLIAQNRLPDVKSEVPLEFSYTWSDLELVVRGRIDFLRESPDGLEVEEVKTTYVALNTLEAGQFPDHEAQLKLYLYFLMVIRPELPVLGRLTYLNLDNLSERSFTLSITIDEGAAFFEQLAQNYLTAFLNRKKWIELRNGSLSQLPFPFPEERPGQRDLMDMVNLAIEQERGLLVEAATGIGKTIAVLYPALKQLASNPNFERIFFLTAKTEGKRIIQKTLQKSRDSGLRLRAIFIEAKGRVCLAPGSDCLPDSCPYAFRYYEKLDEAVPVLLAQELMTPDVVMEFARKLELCPFELSLDLSLEADLIVCDYNYLFDPGVYLRRFFMNPKKKDAVFLIDEAHNLVSRGREMYSASLTEQDLAAFLFNLSKIDPNLDFAGAEVIAYFMAWRSELQDEELTLKRLNYLPEMLQPAMERLIGAIEQLMRRKPILSNPSLRDFYFTLLEFNRVLPLVNREYAIYLKTDNNILTLYLFCLNSGPFLRKKLELSRAAIFFSATLSPMPYFRELLGAGSDALEISLFSPFPKENRLFLHVPGVDTRYRFRESSHERLARSITEMVKARLGNYLVFFPSFTYLQSALPLLRPMIQGIASLYIQYPTMSATQKKDYLSAISKSGPRSNVGMAVLGGQFGEGVDLPGEQLIGVFIVGPGLPMVNEEQELIRAYFNDRDGNGFLYAYLVPGLIRVIQSAGRVFRTPEDKGVVMLVDDRFLQEEYQELLPPDWFQPGRPFSTEEFQEVLRRFWEEK